MIDKSPRFLALFFALITLTRCAVEAPEVDHMLIYESSAEEQIQLNLSWKINGIDDEGSIADVMLYVSRSKDMEDATLDESLGQLTISYSDYRGHQSIIPSRRYLFDAYRFYVGVAYHGLFESNPAITFPMTIDYQIDIVNRKTGDIIKTIEKSMTIESNEPGKTAIDYIYTMDVIENEPTTKDYRNYSFRELAEPIHISRTSDIITTNTFSTENNFYTELIWKVNGDVQGFKSIDLDMYLHDTNNTNVAEFTDLDASSASSDIYEEIRIFPTDVYFKNGVPEKLGFYFFENTNMLGAVRVEYTYRFWGIGDGKIKRYTISGYFDSPPIKSNQGTFYFHADIKKQDGNYVVTKLTPPLAWTP